MNNVGGAGRMRASWSTLKAGDQVEPTVNPLRDGQPGGSFVHAVLSDGMKLGRNQTPATSAAPQ